MIRRKHQCYRIYNCIQAAVARLVKDDDIRKDWAANQVKLLLDLIPQYPQFPFSKADNYVNICSYCYYQIIAHFMVHWLYIFIIC